MMVAAIPHGYRPRRHRHRHPDRRGRPAPSSLTAALAIIPSLPRPLLCRLTMRMIDRLDELDGDADLEPEPAEADGDDERSEVPPLAII